MHLIKAHEADARVEEVEQVPTRCQKVQRGIFRVPPSLLPQENEVVKDLKEEVSVLEPTTRKVAVVQELASSKEESDSSHNSSSNLDTDSIHLKVEEKHSADVEMPCVSLPVKQPNLVSRDGVGQPCLGAAYENKAPCNKEGGNLAGDEVFDEQVEARAGHFLEYEKLALEPFTEGLDAAPAGKKVTCAKNASYPIKGVGKILITISDGSDLCLPDVLYVPRIKKNLLSVSSLAKNGLRVIFEDDRCIVRDRENGYSLITTGTLENGLFVLDRYEKQIQACIAETKTQAMQDAELWHARFGHVGYGRLMTLQRHNMVHDLSLLEMSPRHVCEGCVLEKMHRFAFSQDGSVRVTRKLQLVHSDNETGCKVQTLPTDRGGEYMSGAFKDFLGKKGIKHQCTMPYTPQQNGVAERKNMSLMEMDRCMLKAKSLPHKLWMEAVACAAHVLNRCPTRALKTITPYESWYDRKPSVSYLRVFGCLAYAHIPQQLRGKLDDKAVECIFVEYSSGSKGYRLYNPTTNKIFESHDVIFAETTAQPMVAFDVPHMQT
ncbi:hypothetical protein L7F22_029148 [Adiantum nelumboides]|nr:hypothetical protein [Adiantum nelumboides]